MVHSARDYVSMGLGSSGCPFCNTSIDYGKNGLEERSCPECRPLYKADLAAKKLPPRIRATGTPFNFMRWAIIKRAEADSAEAGWSQEKRRQLVDEIVSIWVYDRVSAQQTVQVQQSQADARRAAIASRSTY